MVQHLPVVVQNQHGHGLVPHQEIGAERQIHAHGRFLNQAVRRREVVGLLLLFRAELFEQRLGVRDQFSPLFHRLDPKLDLALFFVADDGRQVLCVPQRHHHNGRGGQEEQSFRKGVVHQS